MPTLYVVVANDAGVLHMRGAMEEPPRPGPALV